MTNKTILKLDKEIEILEKDLAAVKDGFIKRGIKERLEWKKRQQKNLTGYYVI